MLDSRPQLSLAIGRRPSQLQVPGASSPLARTPITPQTNSFFPPGLDSYFPSFNQGPSTPPISASSALFPPPFPGRRGLLRRNSSLSSVSSSIGDDDDDVEREWTSQEEETVRATYDSCVAKHSLTEAPFPANGPPPSNFTNSVARQIIRAHQGPGRVTRSKTRTAAARGGSSDIEDHSEVEMDAPAPVRWRHGLRATRLKILSLVKERQNAHLEATPRQPDPEATPKRRKAMVRQGSMDFLPSIDNTSTIARLGSMLRQPSDDSFGPKDAAPAHGSRQFNRIRMQRTNSLSTIAGSPSQPLKEKSSSVKAPTPAPASSHRMMRLGSESNVVPAACAAPMSRTLSANGGKGFEGFQRPSHHAAVPPPPNHSLSPPHATSSYTSVTPKKKPAPLVLGEGFSNLHTPSNFNLKRPTSGLGSAFNSPIVGAYPTPESLTKKDGSKRKSWKKAKIETEDQDRMAIEDDGSREQPTFVNQAQGFSLPSHNDNDEALEFSIKRRSRPSLSSSSSFSNASTSSSVDSTSYQEGPRPPKVILTPSLSPTSSFSSLAHEPGTPSPLSSTFDLNDLKLETLAQDAAANASSEEESSEEERAQKTGLGFGFLSQAYVDAGNEARSMREQYGDFAWAIEQRQ